MKGLCTEESVGFLRSTGGDRVELAGFVFLKLNQDLTLLSMKKNNVISHYDSSWGMLKSES